MNHYEALLVSRSRMREMRSERDHDKLVQAAQEIDAPEGQERRGLRLPGWLAVMGRWTRQTRPAYRLEKWSDSPCVTCPIPE
ncbi:MAG: hypothetical protein U0670_10815 [Anaerolineae bacterium]